MTPEQFAYWLQGYFEIANPKELGESEIQVIKDHLATIFDKQTPDKSENKIQVDIPEMWKSSATIC